jgi:hypothetical protein
MIVGDESQRHCDASRQIVSVEIKERISPHVVINFISGKSGTDCDQPLTPIAESLLRVLHGPLTSLVSQKWVLDARLRKPYRHHRSISLSCAKRVDNYVKVVYVFRLGYVKG